MKLKFSTTLWYIVSAIIVVYTLFPLYILLLISFSPVQYTIGAIYPSMIPQSFTLSNIEEAFVGFGLIGPLMKSLIVATMVGTLSLVLGIPAAYGLSRLPKTTALAISTTLFFANMMPSIVIAIPIAISFVREGLYNSIPGLAFVQELVVLPVSIFIMLGAFQSLPKDLLNQARIDGAGLFRTLYEVLIPLAAPGIIASFLLSWMMSWDEFTFAVIISPVTPTLPIVIYENITRGNILASSAFALVVTIPVIFLTLFLSRFLRGEYLTGGFNG